LTDLPPPAVEEQDQVTGRAPGGGVGRVGVLAGSDQVVDDANLITGEDEGRAGRDK
jgi:hypothetical protein